MKLTKIVKISEIFNRLVFPLNFNRFCHPMTLTLAKLAQLGRYESVSQQVPEPRVTGSIPTGGKLYAEFILLFTTKGYKNSNFV